MCAFKCNRSLHYGSTDFKSHVFQRSDNITHPVARISIFLSSSSVKGRRGTRNLFSTSSFPSPLCFSLLLEERLFRSATRRRTLSWFSGIQSVPRKNNWARLSSSLCVRLCAALVYQPVEELVIFFMRFAVSFRPP